MIKRSEVEKKAELSGRDFDEMVSCLEGCGIRIEDDRVVWENYDDKRHVRVRRNGEVEVKYNFEEEWGTYSTTSVDRAISSALIEALDWKNSHDQKNYEAVDVLYALTDNAWAIREALVYGLGEMTNVSLEALLDAVERARALLARHDTKGGE